MTPCDSLHHSCSDHELQTSRELLNPLRELRQDATISRGIIRHMPWLASAFLIDDSQVIVKKLDELEKVCYGSLNRDNGRRRNGRLW